jgi:DNA-binding HxlR family transcriptional regulator
MRQHCRQYYPIRTLSRKWSYLILDSLQVPHSFNELRAELPYITNAMLTRELRLLEKEKFVLHGDKYGLSVSGKALHKVAQPIMKWGEDQFGGAVCACMKKCSSCSRS